MRYQSPDFEQLQRSVRENRTIINIVTFSPSRRDADECAKYAAMVMKKQYDNRHQPIFFNKDDFVYLKLQQGTDPGYVQCRSQISDVWLERPD